MKPGHPVIIYVPGLMPKPEPETHRDALMRCILTGLRRVDEAVADSIEATPGSFDVISWTFDFYHEHRDFELDCASVEAAIKQPAASNKDIDEATSWRRRLTRWLYRLGDLLPFVIPALASERMEVHLRDLLRYEENRDGIADHIRRMLKIALHAAANGRHPILLIGHSMGSVICYDALWELSHDGSRPVDVDRLLTMGSPLGQNFMQRQIKGHNKRGVERYPAGIRHWTNLSAVGDLTAIDPWLGNDFGEMVELGLVESIDDGEFYNAFRLNGELNVHSEYGYLVNEKAARTIAAWWRDHI